MDGASPFTLRKKYFPKIRRVSKLFQTTKMAQVRKGLDKDKLLFVNVFAKASVRSLLNTPPRFAKNIFNLQVVASPNAAERFFLFGNLQYLKIGSRNGSLSFEYFLTRCAKSIFNLQIWPRPSMFGTHIDGARQDMA